MNWYDSKSIFNITFAQLTMTTKLFNQLYKTPPLKNLVCSPLGLVPKNVPGKFRLIHDLSYHKGNSVNSLIPQETSTVKYDGIDTVIQLVKQFGRHCKLSKCDIEDAFRIIPIHPSDYYLRVY
jgi:hypothetical protein